MTPHQVLYFRANFIFSTSGHGPLLSGGSLAVVALELRRQQIQKLSSAGAEL